MNLENYEYWMIVAVIIGPAIGVLLTFLMQHLTAKRARRMDVFRSLMQTRRMRLSQIHVQALNLVEVEFHGKKKVIEKWNDYLKHLGKQAPAEEADKSQFYEEQNKKLTLLVQSIGRVMGRKIEQFEIWDGGYVPVGWENDDYEQRILRKLALDMLSGKQGLPVIVHNPPPPVDAQYPPKPD